MKKLTYFFTIIFLMTTQISWGQTNCSDFSLSDFVDLQFELNYETGDYTWSGTAKTDPPIPYSSYTYNFTVSIDGEAVGGNGGSGDNPEGSTTFSPFENSVGVGIRCVDGELTCANCDATPNQITVEFTFTLGECTYTGNLGTGVNPNECGGGGVTINDERQVGNTIESLGDGRLSALNSDGTVIAFSSSGGYYVCELIGETWTPIGTEIITTAPITEIFITADGRAVFVNLSEGLTPQCSYRSGSSFTTNSISQSGSSSEVTKVWDITADGSYILYQTGIFDGETTFYSTACASISSGGMISSTSVDINETTDITNGAIVGGYLSDDGQYYCVVDGARSETAFYRVTGQEVSTFSGVVISASGNLRSCLVITDVNTLDGVISRWDGASTFYNSASDNYNAITSYSFSASGNTCVGTNTSGQLITGTFSVVNEEVVAQVNVFTVEGLTTYSGVSLSGNGNILGGFGGSSSVNSDLFVFDFNEEEVEKEINDDRQIGNTIRELSDGRVSVLNDDGTVIAFSSSEGYYICELRGEVWTPIGEEIKTLNPVSEIFISADGRSVFVNLSNGSSSQCSYRSEDSFTTTTLTDPNGFGRVTRIWDVTGDGSYILYRTVFSEDGDETISTSCGSLQSGGMITSPVNVNLLTSFSGGSINGGFLSDNGEYFCVVDGQDNRTAFYRITGTGTGTEVSTFTGQVTSASRDLTSCLIITNQTTKSGVITVWDGGMTFTSSDPIDFSTNNSYDFSADGSNCVGTNIGGKLTTARITVVDNKVIIEDDEFSVVGLPNFGRVSVSGRGDRITFPDGDGGDRPDLYIFENDNSMMPMDDTDTDMDGVVDMDDEDDDNDGIRDDEECLSAIDYSETAFGPSQITILTSRGQEVNISVGSMVTDDALFGIGFPNSFNLDRGADNTNRFVMNFPFEIYSLKITAIDFDSDSFGDPTEWMDDFSIFPTLVTGDGRAVAEGFAFGTTNQQVLEGEGIIPDTLNGVMELFWDNLPAGTTSISWNNRRTTMDLDINFQLDAICIDTDGDRIPNEKDPDSDGDGCLDVEEAGHADDDDDGYLGNSPVAVDDNGLVTGQGGYTGLTDDVLIVNEGCEEVDECDELDITATPDNFTTCPSEDLVITSEALLSNDIVTDGVTLEIQELTLDNAADGTLVNNEDGTWTLTASAEFSEDITLSYVVKRDDESLVFEENGHLYEFVPAQDISWADARDAAAERMLGGLRGYLATISTQSENDFIQTKLQGRGWLGGREIGGVNTGEWRWVTGPEGQLEDGSGLQFWDGNIGGSPIDNVYQNWRDGEPNNATSGHTEGGEQFLHIRFDLSPGKWNDYPSIGYPNNTQERIAGYIVEYGGLEECDSEFTATGTVTVSLADDCSTDCFAFSNVFALQAASCDNPNTNIVLFTEPFVDENYEISATDEDGLEITFEILDDGNGFAPVLSGLFTGTVTIALTDLTLGCTTQTTFEVADPVDADGNPCPGDGTDECDEDMTDPVITCPNDITVTATELDSGFDTGAATATDNCDDVTPTSEDQVEENDCGRIITRTWTATDSKGNVATCTQTITVVNSEDISGSGYGCPDPSAANYNPNAICDDGSCIYEGCDDCSDTTPPVFEGIEVFIEGECGEISIEELGITATDNCGDVTITFEDFNFSPSCLGSLQRTYTATDMCGNTTQAVQIIDLTNENGPIIECPEDVTLACIDEIPAAVNPEVSHGCGLDVTIEFNETTEAEGCSTIITREWTATDECGGVSTCVQIITVVDDEAPILPTGIEDLNVQCASEVPAPAVLTAEDNCGMIEGVFREDIADGGCSDRMTVTRFWTFVDECGNSSELRQTITVADTIAPVPPTPPADLTVQCAEDIPDPANLTASDNCNGFVDGTSSDIRTNESCENKFTITRTWAFTDECGNTSLVSQIINVDDDTAPVPPTTPADISIDCASEIPPIEELFAMDNCNGQIAGNATDERIADGDCPNSFTVIRTWTFTDFCGNTSSISQTISVNDMEAPVPPDAPAAITVQCADDIPVSVELRAMDNCDGTVDGVVTDTRTNGDCDNKFTVTRTWTFTDLCGNTSEATQIITVADTISPEVINAPMSVTLQCASEVPLEEDLTAMDNCSGLITSSPSDVITPGSCDNSFTITRTWIFIDDCENETSVSQTITIEDDIAPEVPEAPADIDVQCRENIPEAVELLARDNCSGIITGVITEVETPGDCPNSFIVVRTWTFTDDCDNPSAVRQIITVDDTQAPVPPQAPANVTVQCEGDVPEAEILTAEDNCGDIITGVPTDVVTPGDCLNSFMVTRTWTFTDACNNSSMTSQIIIVDDMQAPIPPQAPANVNVQCEGDVPVAEILTAEDNCGSIITGVPTDVVTPGDCPNNFIVTRTWTFTDACNNSSTTSQTITVDDMQAPVPPEAPMTITVQCEENIPEAQELMAFDNCDGFILGIISDVETPGDCPNNFEVTRTWTFTDKCGNSNTISQTIIVDDNRTPVLPEIPASITVLCAEDVPQAEELIAQDNCSGAVMGSVTEMTTPGDCSDSFTVTRTWTFTDDCGNSISASQTITVDDTEAPTFVDQPEDVTFECYSDVGEIMVPEAIDNCQEQMVTCDTVENLDECQNGTITVTCTAEDNCGNVSTTSYTITINDTTAPELTGVPEDLTLSCEAELPAVPVVMGDDNCNGEVTINFTEIINGGEPLECILGQPAEPVCHETENWAMVLFDLPVGQYFSNVETNFAEFADGTAQITGTVSDNSNPQNGGFTIDARFSNRMDWNEWSTQSFPTSFKDECGTGNHETWSYYLLAEGSTLTGYGTYEGSLLTLIHAPENKFFGYQVGQGANNVNESFGNGGWFIAEGTVVQGGQSFPNVRTAGDFAFDGDCCTSYEVERIWTANDCSGNTSQEESQIITIEGTSNFVDNSQQSQIEADNFNLNSGTGSSIGGDILITQLAPNPSSAQTTISYVLDMPMDLRIDLVDLNGYSVRTIFRQNVAAGVEQYQTINTEDLSSGVYYIRVNSGKELFLKKLVVAKR